MEHVTFRVPGFAHDAGDVTAWAEAVLGVRAQASVTGDVITIHPWPRPLGPDELERLRAVLEASIPFELEADRDVIWADGRDAAIVRIYSRGESVRLLVRDREVEVPLKGGVGQIEITARVPTSPPHIEVRAADQMRYGFSTVRVRAI